MRLRAEKTTWEAGEKPTFTADVRNRGARDLHIFRSSDDWELEYDEVWHVSILRSGTFSTHPLRATDRIYSAPINFNIWQRKGAVVKPGEKLGTIMLKSPPKPGKHTIRVAFKALSKDGRKSVRVRAVSNPVEITIGPALPGSQVSIKDALADPDFAFAAVCKSLDESSTQTILGRSGYTNHGFTLINLLAGEAPEENPFKLSYGASMPIVVDPPPYPQERFVRRNEQVIWIVRRHRQDGERVAWKGIKALPDTPENRKALLDSIAPNSQPAEKAEKLERGAASLRLKEKEEALSK